MKKKMVGMKRMKTQVKTREMSMKRETIRKEGGRRR